MGNDLQGRNEMTTSSGSLDLRTNLVFARWGTREIVGSPFTTAAHRKGEKNQMNYVTGMGLLMLLNIMLTVAI